MKCEIIQDLLNSYIENTCSEETRLFVEKHLSECEECQSLYNELTNDHEIEYKIIDEKKVFKKVKKNLITKILLVCISFIMLFTIFGSELSCYIVKSKMKSHVYMKGLGSYEMIDFYYEDNGIHGFGKGGSYCGTFKGFGDDERFVVTTDGFWMEISDSYEYHIEQRHRTAERLEYNYQADILNALYKDVPEIILMNGYSAEFNLMVRLKPNMIPDKVYDYKIDVFDYLDLNMRYHKDLDKQFPFCLKIFLEVDEDVFESEEIVKRIFNILKEEDFHISTIEIQLNCKGKEKVIEIEDMKY